MDYLHVQADNPWYNYYITLILLEKVMKRNNFCCLNTLYAKNLNGCISNSEYPGEMPQNRETGTLANIDPDEMQHKVTFHQCLHCMLRYEQSVTFRDRNTSFYRESTYSNVHDL